MNTEFKENLVATTVDVASILFAYNIGVHQFGWEFGLGYAAFDAYVVIWEKKRLTSMLGWISSFIRGKPTEFEDQEGIPVYLGKFRWQ